MEYMAATGQSVDAGSKTIEDRLIVRRERPDDSVACRYDLPNFVLCAAIDWHVHEAFDGGILKEIASATFCSE